MLIKKMGKSLSGRGWKKRSGRDRRSKLGDRRIRISIDYFLKGGAERRSWKERRSGLEQRSNQTDPDESCSSDKSF